MNGTGKVFRMAKVPDVKQHIDMRYSRDDGMWYPSQPAAPASGRKNSFGMETAGGTTKSHPNGKEKDTLIIICDIIEDDTSNHDEGSAGYRNNSEVQRPMVLILDVDSVQDLSSDQAEHVSTPYPPAGIIGPLSAERSLPMA